MKGMVGKIKLGADLRRLGATEDLIKRLINNLNATITRNFLTF
ncbi:hypothetical protein EV207_14041 [Scopulibacillus darangshiensis]|uniref:Uncharacterized protein n=1 Tax=Scopulibacillus darangshiensis TaxID=442528 RepID=A0A4R2NK31_9BACL|nr:hypothetical protein EV207_14041 [Scopulibacillus darangshiensis]